MSAISRLNLAGARRIRLLPIAIRCRVGLTISELKPRTPLPLEPPVTIPVCLMWCSSVP